MKNQTIAILVFVNSSLLFSSALNGQTAVPATRIQGSTIRPATASSGSSAQAVPSTTSNAVPLATSRAATSGAARKEDVQTKSALQLQFNRSPGAILRTWSQVNSPDAAKPEPPGPENEAATKAKAVKKFEQNVVLSQWSEASQFLRSVSPADAQKIYSHLLTQLQSVPALQAVPSSAEPLPAGVVVASPAGVPPDDHVISGNDVVGLIHLAPADLNEQNISAIGMLLSKSMRQGFGLGPVIEAFEKGIRNIGGVDKSHRLNAARILLSGNRPKEASSFVDSLETALMENNAPAIVVNSAIAQAEYAADRKPELLMKAWKANQAVLATGEAKATDRQAALQLAVNLAPKVGEEVGEAWLRKSFADQPARGIKILAGIGQATAEGQQLNRHNPALRLEGLKLQKNAVDVLLDAAPEKASEWNQTLVMLALNWLKEARFSQTYARSSGRPVFRRDRYGNIYYASSDELRGMVGGSSSSLPRPIPVQDILDSQPQNQWFETLEPGLQSEFVEMLARLYLKNAEESKAFPFIEKIALTDKKRAKRLIDEFLRVWTQNHNPNENRGNRNQYIYFFGFEQRANSIPLTRSKQQRNLKELREWIARIKSMELDEIDEQALVRAFTTCHSSAEVYRIEDIEEVFGSIQKLKANTVAGLVQKMRTNLSTAWRQPRVQESKKTNRKEPEIQQEVQRGYEVAAKIVKEALFEHPQSWELLLAKACVNFDRNAYQQEVKKSSEFTEKQQAVFGEFAEAATAYHEQVAEMEEDEHTTEVYDLWFYAALGACDLALLTHEKLSIDSQFPLIREAMDKLPGEAPKGHLSQFANKLFTRMSPLKPEMKYRYLKGGFTIVGDHPDAVDARKVFQYYKDLVTEIQLQTRIDGSDVVGTKPFGLFVNLYHTEEVERESGGFAKYLQNQNNMTYAYNYGRPTNDYRDAFETAAIAALSEHFEVISVTFEDEKNIESREAPQPGWRVTPYAYLLLKARGEEVDIIPPVKLDLDFLDTSGYAVLPIESKAIPVDTREIAADARPMNDLEVIQTLDERRSGEGKLVLEVKATAKGLIPDFNEILKFEDQGFEVIEEQDQGVSVSAFDPESTDIQVVAEREWLVELKAKEGTGIPDKFEFCNAIQPETNLVFKRYIDADLVEVEQLVDLENQYGSVSYGWMYWVIGGTLAAVAVTLTLVMVRSPEKEIVDRYRRPEEITPLSVIGLLKQIREDRCLADDKQVQLEDSISKIEEHYFFSPTSEVPDLEKEADRWLALAN